MTAGEVRSDGSGDTDAVLLHEGVPFTTPGQLAAVLAPRLSTALDNGGPVVAVLDDPVRTALAAQLGAASLARLELLDPAEVYRVPAFTVAVRWARLSRRAEPGGRVTIVGQHVDDLPDDGHGYWARLDSALNVALHGLPVAMLCPFPDNPDVVPLFRSTHRTLLAGGHSVPSDDYRDPHEVVAEYPPPPPPDLGRPEVVESFTLDVLGRVRRHAAAVGSTAGLAADQVADFVLAVNEIASNSVEHGPGSGRLRIWRDGRQVVAEVADDGRMSVPFPGLVAPPATGARGRGLWLASELSDVLQVWSDASGTVIRVTMTR
jgi:anti-sigma regulatory factor (Ser/Thr protein kinase)